MAERVAAVDSRVAGRRSVPIRGKLCLMAEGKASHAHTLLR